MKLATTIAVAAGFAAALGVAAPARAQTMASAGHCADLHREAADLGFRLDNTLDPLEHARLAGKLHIVHDQEDGCGP